MNDNIQVIEGYFKIETIDKNGNSKIILEQKNQIQNPINWMMSRACWNSQQVSLTDFIITGFAIGTDGIDDLGNPKSFEVLREQLFSEEKFWNNELPEEQTYVYQVNFQPNISDDIEISTKISEGTTLPATNGIPDNYLGNPVNDPDLSDSTIMISRRYEDQVLYQEITIGKQAGNGIGQWAPNYSEAAFYMKRDRTSDGRKLGSILSMKTFPRIEKNSEVMIKITWNFNFQR